MAVDFFFTTRDKSALRKKLQK